MFILQGKVLKLLKNVFHCKYYSQSLEEHTSLLQKYFDISTEDAKSYINAHRLARIDPTQIANTLNYCTRLGFSPNSMIDQPMLLRANPILLEQRYKVMEECGMKITPYYLAKFRTYCKMKITALKDLNLIDSDANVAQRFITYLDPCPPGFSVGSDDRQSWLTIHHNVTFAYLRWRLQASAEEIKHLYRVHVGISRKSFRFLCENIKIAEDLGFEKKKIIKYGYIICNYPNYPKMTLERWPTLCGIEMKKAMRMYPKIITTSPSNIEKIYAILKEYGIPDETIRRRMNVLHLSPETVRTRLENIVQDDETRILLHNPYILKLIVHHNRAQLRLHSLKKLQLKCAGVHLLGKDSVQFDTHVKDGRDHNTYSDIKALLTNLLNSTAFEQNIKLHPNYLNVPLLSIEKSFNWLIKRNFTRAEISDVICIVLYPKKKLEESYQKSLEFEKCRQRTLTSNQQLNLMWYFMEKEHHFTGNGIWIRGQIPEDTAFFESHPLG